MHYLIFFDREKEKTKEAKNQDTKKKKINGGDEWVFRFGQEHARAPHVLFGGRHPWRRCAGCSREQRFGLFAQGRARRSAAQVERSACKLPRSTTGKKKS